MEQVEKTKKEVVTTTEFKVSTKSNVDQGVPMPRAPLPMTKEYKTAIGNGTGLYGPGSRPLKIDSEKRTLSGSSNIAANTIRDEREREKKEISELNDRLASYIEKVRFLDAQNRKMSSDLKLFRARMGSDAVSTRKMYEGELLEARKLIATTNEERLELEKSIPKLVAEITDYQKRYDDAVKGREIDRKRIEDLIVSFTDLEREENILRRRITESETEVAALRKINGNYIAGQNRLRTEIEHESLSRIDHQNRAQMVLEEIEFARREQEQELRDLQAAMVRDTTHENQEYFRNELASAIRIIREEYDQIMAGNRNEIEAWYKLKVQEMQSSTSRVSLEQGYAREEVKRLRSQLSDIRGRVAKFEGRNSLLEKQIIDMNYQLEDEQRRYEATLQDRDAMIRNLREECDALVVELQRLLDTKESLEQEIITYRKLLEGEESRAGLRRLVQQVVKAEVKKPEVVERSMAESGETINKITFQGTATGIVSIQDAAVDGKFIVIENTSETKDELMGSWQIKRSVDNSPDIVYTFPKDFVLKPLKTVKIWARDQGGINKPPEQLIFEGATSFGSGINARTVLVNTSGEERAVHQQKTSQTTVIFGH